MNFAPTPGTSLHVTRQSPYEDAERRFRNLAHGQIVSLEFNERFYDFVANYHGGTGNDLVLEWAHVQLASWGANGDGQLGNGSQSMSSKPEALDDGGAFENSVPLIAATGGTHTLALLSSGDLYSWGSNGRGQLGNATTVSQAFPGSVSIADGLVDINITALTAGESHSLAVTSDGKVVVWGSNSHWQLGISSSSYRSAPFLIRPGYGRILSIAAGARHNILLRTSGDLWAWGDNSSGQLGRASSLSKSASAALVSRGGVLAFPREAIGAAAGSEHNLVVCSDGTLATWGRGTEGQLGIGDTISRNAPIEVPRSGVLAGKKPITVATGAHHSLVLCDDGALVAWGSNSHGQLGSGSDGDQSNTPVLVEISGVLLGKEIVSIGAGARHSFAFCSDGTLTAWGDNALGQLGVEGPTSSNVPVVVDMTSFPQGSRIIRVSTQSTASHTNALVALPNDGPKILVLDADGGRLSSGFSIIDFGNLAPRTDATTTFTIINSGDEPLTGLAATISGTDAALYSLSTVPPSSLEPRQSTTFSVQLAPGLSGAIMANLRIASNIEGPLNPFIITLTGRGLSASEAWREIYFGDYANSGLAADSSDANGDGEVNLMEFATGQSPHTYSVLPITISLTPSGFAFDYNRNPDAVSDVSFAVEWTDDLATGTWKSDGVSETVLEDDGTIQTVRAMIPGVTGSTRFVRLRIATITVP